MGQIVTLNGRPNDLDWRPSLKVGTRQDRTPVEINGKTVHGVNINGYDYPPCEPECVLYLPGLPGYGSKIWDRSVSGNHGTIVGATWVKLASGQWSNYFDGLNDRIELGDTDVTNNANFSLKFWVKGAAQTDKTFYGEGDSTSNDGFFLLGTGYADSSKVRIVSRTSAGVWEYSFEGAITAFDDTWHLVVFTYANPAYALYIDGVLDLSGSQAITAKTMDRVTVGARGRLLYLNLFTGQVCRETALLSTLSGSSINNQYNQERHIFGV